MTISPQSLGSNGRHLSTWPPTTGPNQTMQRTRGSDRRKQTWQGCGNIMTHRRLKESAAKGILKIFSKMWKPRSGDSAQSLQIFLRRRRQGHIKCKHHEQSEKPSNMLSDSAGIPRQQQLSICTSQQGSNRSVMGNGWWTLEETRIFTLARHWCCRTGTLTLPLCASLGLSAHFASPDASQVRVFSVCLCKWFLPVLRDFPLSWGPSTVLSCQVLCDAVLLTHLASFPPISAVQLLLIYPSFFCHSFFLQTGLLRPPPCSQLYHI